MIDGVWWMFNGNVYFGSTALANTLLIWCTLCANLNVLESSTETGQILSKDNNSLYHWETHNACERDCKQTYVTLSDLSLSQSSLHWLRSDDDVHFHSERRGEDGLSKEDHKKAWGSHSKALQVRSESPKLTFLTLLTTYLSF